MKYLIAIALLISTVTAEARVARKFDAEAEKREARIAALSKAPPSANNICRGC